jgi:hypothetical protein
MVRLVRVGQPTHGVLQGLVVRHPAGRHLHEQPEDPRLRSFHCIDLDISPDPPFLGPVGRDSD